MVKTIRDLKMIEVNKDKCGHCNICVNECPVGLLESSANDVPKAHRVAPRLCIDCGHCIVVCPSGALTFKDISPEECEVIQKDLKISPEQAEQFLKAKRSVRTYKDKLVDKQMIEKLLEIASSAPSAKNKQPTKWVVVEGKDKIKEMSSLVIDWMKTKDEYKALVMAWEKGDDKILRESSYLVVPYTKSDAYMPFVDSTIALTYFELAATSMGLATCYAGFFEHASNEYAPIKEFLGLEKGDIITGGLMFGYPKFKYHRIPKRNEVDVRYL